MGSELAKIIDDMQPGPDNMVRFSKEFAALVDCPCEGESVRVTSEHAA